MTSYFGHFWELASLLQLAALVATAGSVVCALRLRQVVQNTNRDDHDDL